MTSVAIVGGGIAGMALAATLDSRRFQVTIHEAQPERAGSGAALALWPGARRALDRLGASQALAMAGTSTTGGWLHDLAGRRVVPLPAPVVLVPRPALLAALSACVPPSVRWVEEAVTAPGQLSADIVVGADGVRSVVRPLVRAAAAERRATSLIALRGLSPRLPRPFEEGEYWGWGLMAGTIGMGERSYWFTTHRSSLGPEPLAADEVLAEARARFGNAAPVIRETLDAPGDATSATRLWLAPPMRRYARGRYVVIGDAAHAMTPNLGRGACEAILDAVSLGRSLNSGRSPLAWEARRVPLTQVARAASGLVMATAIRGRL